MEEEDYRTLEKLLHKIAHEGDTSWVEKKSQLLSNLTADGVISLEEIISWFED